MMVNQFRIISTQLLDIFKLLINITILYLMQKSTFRYFYKLCTNRLLRLTIRRFLSVSDFFQLVTPHTFSLSMVKNRPCYDFELHHLNNLFKKIKLY